MPPSRSNLDPDGIYARLGLAPDAGREAIVAAYRGKARVLHPDVPATGNAAAFVAVKQAYDILSNRDRREAYDRAASLAAGDPIQPAVFTAPPVYAASHTPVRTPRFSDLPVAVWLGLGACLTFSLIEAVLHLRTETPVVRAEIRPNAVTVAPLSQSAHEAVLYGPAPARLPGTPNFYVVPAATPAILWRLDKERNTLVPQGQLPAFSSVQAVRLYRQNGMLEVLVGEETTGFIQTGHLTPGDAQASRRAYCAYNAGPTPTDGEVLERRGSGTATLQLENRSVQPAVLKLRNAAGMVVVSVFLAPGGYADVHGIAPGTYHPDFATGELWSRACNTFAAGMRARRLNEAFEIPSPQTLVMSADNTGSPADDMPDQAFEDR